MKYKKQHGITFKSLIYRNTQTPIIQQKEQPVSSPGQEFLHINWFYYARPVL